MNINTFTAKGYTVQQRLIGLFVSYGSLLAILLELGLISAGFTLKGSSLTTNIFQVVLWGVAGLLVGLLVVKMSLTNATKLRSSLDKEEQLRADYQKRARELVVIPQSVQDALTTDIEETKKGRIWIYLLLALGCGFSIVCEAIVMSLLFAAINPAWAGDLLSLFLSTLVTFTMVSGELHKSRDHEIIKQAMSHDSFLELAAKASVYDAFNKKMIAEAAIHVEEILDNDVLNMYAKRLVFSSIEENTGQMNFAKQIEAAKRNKELQTALEDEENRRLLAHLRGDTEPALAVTAGPTCEDEQRIPEEKPNSHGKGPRAQDIELSVAVMLWTHGYSSEDKLMKCFPGLNKYQAGKLRDRIIAEVGANE